MSSWRDVAVFLDGSPAGERIAGHAAEIATRHAAHLIGMFGAVHPRSAAPAESFARGAEGINQVLERHRRETEVKAVTAGRAFAAVTEARALSSEFRVVWRDSVDDDAALHALHCDLVICSRPKPVDLPQGWTGEHVLLASGVPVLLVPDTWTGSSIGDHVAVAWNGSREARRAVADALPFLSAAQSVTIISIERHNGRSAPGEELLQHLERHEITAQVRTVQAADGPTSQILADQVGEIGADCLVIGAYSRPRSAEILFGGTTRNLLARCPVPLFLSR